MHYCLELLRAFSVLHAASFRLLPPYSLLSHGEQTNNSGVAFPDFVRKAEKRHCGELFRHLNLVSELAGPFPRQRVGRYKPQGSAEEEEDAI